jgi:hypothetical protein
MEWRRAIISEKSCAPPQATPDAPYHPTWPATGKVEAVCKRSKANKAENCFLYRPFSNRGYSVIPL